MFLSVFSVISLPLSLPPHHPPPSRRFSSARQRLARPLSLRKVDFCRIVSAKLRPFFIWTRELAPRFRQNVVQTGSTDRMTVTATVRPVWRGGVRPGHGPNRITARGVDLVGSRVEGAIFWALLFFPAFSSFSFSNLELSSLRLYSKAPFVFLQRSVEV